MRPCLSGRSTGTRRSKRPGRSSAESSTSPRFVAAMTITPELPEKPSISVRIWLSVCSRSSFVAIWPPPERWRPIASISSMKMIAGAFFFASENRLRMRLAPTPTNISTNSEPDVEMNGTPASPATARASSVLPVPGGPSSSTPRGDFAPTLVYFSGFLRKSTTSVSSSLDASQPATSSNVTPVLGSIWIFDLGCIICIGLPGPPAGPPPPPPPPMPPPRLSRKSPPRNRRGRRDRELHLVLAQRLEDLGRLGREDLDRVAVAVRVEREQLAAVLGEDDLLDLVLVDLLHELREAPRRRIRRERGRRRAHERAADRGREPAERGAPAVGRGRAHRDDGRLARRARVHARRARDREGLAAADEVEHREGEERVPRHGGVSVVWN